MPKHRRRVTVGLTPMECSNREIQRWLGQAVSMQTITMRYRKIKKLGEGRLGTVYLADEADSNRRVALKVIAGDFAPNTPIESTVVHELDLAASLKHPNITKVYDYGLGEDGNIYIATEYLEGSTLKEILRAGTLDLSRAVSVALQVAEALHFAHQSGIVHLALKPGNVMVTGQGDTVRLMDFGMARIGTAIANAHASEAEKAIGAPAYMSPEQIRRTEVTSKSDIYSFGIILYEMLTDVVPFRAPTTEAVLEKHINEAPLSVSHLRKEIPSSLEQVVMQALEKDPLKRPESLNDAIKVLRNLDEKRSPNGGADKVARTQIPAPVAPTIVQTQYVPHAAFDDVTSQTQAKNTQNAREREEPKNNEFLQPDLSPDVDNVNYNRTILASQTIVETMTATPVFENPIHRWLNWKWLASGLGLITMIIVFSWLFFWTDTNPDSSTKGEIVSVNLRLDRSELNVGEQATAKLIARFADGVERDLSQQEDVEWLNSEPSVLRMGPSGQVEASNIGSAKLTARYKGKETPAVLLVVSGQPRQKFAEANLLKLTILGGKRQVKVNDRLTLRVKGTYSSGNESEITQDVRWETSDGTLATVDEKGSLLAQKAGKVAVIARSGNLASEPLNLSIKPALTKLASKAGNVTKTTKAADASEFIRAARSFRDRGSYAEAFNELAKASKVDPSNKEVQVEVAITQRACNAEKNLGRADLRC